MHAFLILRLAYMAVVCSAAELDYPVTVSGNYWILGCGSQSATVQHLLQKINRYVYEAVESIDGAGPVGTAISRKFFGGVDPNILRPLLERTATGPNITLTYQNGQESYHPTIVCANSFMPEIEKFWLHCQESNSKRQASWAIGTQFVVICSRTFSLKMLPEPSDCFKRLRNGRFHGGQSLARTQLSVLFHELVHLYLNQSSLKPEVYRLSDIVDLSPADSVKNPANYVFYLASKGNYIPRRHLITQIIKRL